MEQRMSAWEARRQFGKVLKEITRNNTSVVVELHGDPVAVVVPFEDYLRMKREKASFYDQIRQISERVNLSEAEAAPIIAEAMRATGRLPE
jgi:prevent-host-death family protein